MKGVKKTAISGTLEDLIDLGAEIFYNTEDERRNSERNVLVDSLKQNGWRITRFYRDLLLAAKSGSKNLYVGMDGNRPETGE